MSRERLNNYVAKFTDLGDVERVPPELFSLLERHHLDVERPRRKVPVGDRVVKIPDGVVRISSRQRGGFGSRKVLDALIGLSMFKIGIKNVKI